MRTRSDGLPAGRPGVLYAWRTTAPSGSFFVPAVGLAYVRRKCALVRRRAGLHFVAESMFGGVRVWHVEAEARTR